MRTFATTGTAYKYLYHDSVHNCTYVAPQELVKKLYYNWEDFMFDLKEVKNNGVYSQI